MNILIDKEAMRFLCKMENHSTLSKLADIECPHIAVAICYCDSAVDFAEFTELELALLIKNSNGPAMHTAARPVLQATVYEIAKALPTRTVNAFEVDMQLRAIPEGDKGRYLYVPGSHTPKPADGLAELPALTCAAGSVTAPASAPQHAPATVAAGTAAQAPSASSSDDFTMPKVGTSTHTIFMFCANLWKETGYTNDKSTLDNIRKKAVDQLVPTGLNISTVRTQAARWYQHRQRLVA